MLTKFLSEKYVQESLYEKNTRAFLNKKLKNIAGAKSLNLEEIYVYMNAKKSGSIIRTLEDGQNAEERMKWQNIAGNGFKKSLITLWLQQPKFTLLWA